MKPPIVLSMCDRTCRALEPWNAAGFECWAVDLQHPPGANRGGDGIIRVGADIRHWLPPRREYLFAMGFPPCTDLSVSGARWFRKKGLRALSEAIDVFGAVVDRLEWCECPAFAENPVSVIATEATLGSLMHRLPPSDGRGDLRSIWAKGFSLACFEANRRTPAEIAGLN